MALYALLEWTEEQSLGALPVTSIVTGNQAIGEIVQANYQRKTYDAKILNIGEWYNYSLFTIYLHAYMYLWFYIITN